MLVKEMIIDGATVYYMVDENTNMIVLWWKGSDGQSYSSHWPLGDEKTANISIEDALYIEKREIDPAPLMKKVWDIKIESVIAYYVVESIVLLDNKTAIQLAEPEEVVNELKRRLEKSGMYKCKKVDKTLILTKA
jgi:hypothetical protein